MLRIESRYQSALAKSNFLPVRDEEHNFWEAGDCSSPLAIALSEQKSLELFVAQR